MAEPAEGQQAEELPAEVTPAEKLPAAVRALLDPALHGCPPGAVELRETHASWVVLAGERAYKVKKPVRFAFLDQSTLELRRAACTAELELNRVLAADVYLSVRALVPAAAPPLRLGDADDPSAVEYAVEMRRFDESATLAGLAARGAVDGRQLRDVATTLAAFHRDAPVAEDAPQTAPAALAATLALHDRNAEELIELLDDAGERAAVLAQRRAARAFAAAHAELLAARAASGRVRELHGDLRAEHVLPGPPVRIVDRLEFNAVWRRLDVADELAFLAMDLTALGVPDATRTLLAAYRTAGGDPGDDALVAYHAVYRAQVRAKVALLRARQAREEGRGEAGTSGAGGGGAGAARAGALLAVAERFTWELRLPRVLVVCGAAASGKSSLAAELARRSGRPVLSSDRARKRLVGVAATDRAEENAYTPELNARTYAQLADDAAAAPGGAIVDATFRLRADRDAFGDALRDVPVSYVQLLVPADELEARAARRLADPNRISDATPALALAQHAAFEPLDEIPPERLHLLRADRLPARLADALAAALDAR